MSRAQISQHAAGHLQLSGEIDYLSGPALREQGGRLIASNSSKTLVLDCSGVTRSSSVGLALLLAFMRDAKAAGCECSIKALPAELAEIAKVCGALEILPLQA